MDFEETGWFDGGVEPKGPMTLSRDRLIWENDARPPAELSRQAALRLLAAWALSAALLAAALNVGPRMFDEYDAVVLKNLAGNDDLSRIAADQSRGRPTYCKSRYYKALANGGQGC